MGLTLSNAVEHARGWVATKMGLLDIFDVATMIEISRALYQQFKAKLYEWIPNSLKECGWSPIFA